MKNDFTLNDLIHKNSENVSDDDLDTEHNHPTEQDGLELRPRKQVIANIMSYSRALNVVKTKSMGDLKFLIN